MHTGRKQSAMQNMCFGSHVSHNYTLPASPIISRGSRYKDYQCLTGSGDFLRRQMNTEWQKGHPGLISKLNKMMMMNISDIISACPTLSSAQFHTLMAPDSATTAEWIKTCFTYFFRFKSDFLFKSIKKFKSNYCF